MTKAEEQADEKIRKWLGEVFPPERKECDKDYCELVKEQHQHD